MSIATHRTTATAPPGENRDGGTTAFDYGLYATTILVWGTSWYAIRLQLGVVAPEVSIVWRFMLATAIMLIWAAATRAPLKFSVGLHVKFAMLGVTIFSSNFALFYYAGQYVASGLLAVMFSLSSILNVLMSAFLFREKLEGRLILGGLFGVCGVACMFLPEVIGVSLNVPAFLALALGIGATLSFCFGNMMSRSLQNARAPLLSANLWGMVYGTLWMAFIAIISGHRFTIDFSVPYISSLLFLAVFSTVIAFACYLSLVRRIGPGRAAYATAMFPIVALAVSTAFEGYQWTFIAIVGMALALLGNVLVLRKRRS